MCFPLALEIVESSPLNVSFGGHEDKRGSETMWGWVNDFSVVIGKDRLAFGSRSGTITFFMSIITWWTTEGILWATFLGGYTK